ncbi:MAG TPA: tetratricopeptide repeat protein [Aridibacter sp.]|nr:tetratricopeptide repeat protein [Aridibacter sp.]
MITAILLLTCQFPAHAQDGLNRGIQLYQEGKYKESVSVLEAHSKQDKGNSRVWNFLGLGYAELGEMKAARKAFKKAIKYDKKNILYRGNLAMIYISEGEFEDAEDEFKEILKLEPADANTFYYRGIARYYDFDRPKAIEDADRALEIEPRFAKAVFLKMDATLTELVGESKNGGDESKIGRMMGSTRQALTRCLEVCTDSSLNEVRDRIESLGVFERYLLRSAGVAIAPLPDDVSTQDLKILSKPRPGYSDKARAGGESGTVILIVEFKSNGNIGYVAVFEALRYGLTERAIIAARGIRFEPFKVDGKPQTVLKFVHYRFSIY